MNPSFLSAKHPNQTCIIEGGECSVVGECRVTKEMYSVTMPVEQYTAWQGGTLAQVAFRGMSAEDREWIISGTSPEGFTRLFPMEGDENN